MQRLWGAEIRWIIPRIKEFHGQRRAETFLELYPWTVDVDYPKVHFDHIYDLVRGAHYIEDKPEVQPYCLNAQLNHGVRLEDCNGIDSKTTWNVDFPLEFVPGLPSTYDILYVAKGILGESRLNPTIGTWDVHKWIEFMYAFWDKFGEQPLIMVGADYDEESIKAIERHLPVHSIFINRPPRELLYILKNARWFLGYQSGLGIHADNLGTNQIMLYFNYLQPLRYAWNCKYRSNFFGYTFSNSPQTVIDQTWTEFSNHASKES